MADQEPLAPSRRAVLTGTAALVGLAGVASCSQAPAPAASPSSPADRRASLATSRANGGAAPTAAPASPATVVSRATVPVLCYHQVRDWTPDDSSYTRASLVCPPKTFRAQLDTLSDAGYVTISPDRYRDHLFHGTALPERPVLLTFDDGKDNQRLRAAPELARRDMTATFFVMTVVLDKPGWATGQQVRELADLGMTIGAHTWDHPNLARSARPDWEEQLVQPRRVLAKLSGQPVFDLAFPYGAWDGAVLRQVRAAGYHTAYQLSDRPMDPAHPELTLRRLLVNTGWASRGLLARLQAGGQGAPRRAAARPSASLA